MNDAKEYTRRLCQVLTNRIGLTEEECKYIAGLISEEAYSTWWNSLGYTEKSDILPRYKYERYILLGKDQDD